MKITKQYLKQVIKEEINKIVEQDLPESPKKLTPEESENYAKLFYTTKFNSNELMRAIRMLPYFDSDNRSAAANNLVSNIKDNRLKEFSKIDSIKRARIDQYFQSSDFRTDLTGILTPKQADAIEEKIATFLTKNGLIFGMA